MTVAQMHTCSGSPADSAVTVVGAGPAGLACANVLARADRTVIVREWHSTVGGRFHGDFQGLENWSDERDVFDELRAADIDADFDCHPAYESTVFDSWGEAYRVRGERPLYYLVRRGSRGGSLDFGLLKLAIGAGAEVRFDDRVTQIDRPAILAIGPRLADAIAAGYVFETGGPDGSWAAFDNALAPPGYAYLEMHDPKPFGGLANFRLPRRAVQGGHPVIGEQAGFQNALAGFGMRYALRSGILAARSMIQGIDYTALWRRELLPLRRTGTSNRFIFNTVGERGWRWALRGLSLSDTAAKLRRFYRPSILARLIYPLSYMRYRGPLRDPSCDHVDYGCVWCQHGAHGAVGTATSSLSEEGVCH